MIALLRKLDSSVKIAAELDIEVDRLPFHVSVEDGEALVLVDRWRDTLVLARHLSSGSQSFKHTFTALDSELRRLGITVCVRRRGVAVLGPKASPLYGSLAKHLVPFLTRG
jgi:hypothetical protein